MVAVAVVVEGLIDANENIKRALAGDFTKTDTLKRRIPVKIAGHRSCFCDGYRNLNTAHHV